jgi:deoxyribose-phosphate aldolase
MPLRPHPTQGEFVSQNGHVMLDQHRCRPHPNLACLSHKTVTLNDSLDNPKAVASLIDHTLLKPDATRADVARLCKEARQFGFVSVCVNPYWVRFAAELLTASSVNVGTVVGFPFGANDEPTKLTEAERALSNGAEQLDMVQNIGALRSQELDVVSKEIADVAALAHSHGAILKVILETSLLSDDEKITACNLASEANADFVKTSTGFSTGGATLEDVKLMRQTVGPSMGVKASGGIRTLEALRLMVSAGANRIGTSSGVSILSEISNLQRNTRGQGAS